MAPKRKPVAESGGVQRRNGGFRARVQACTGDKYGPTRSTEEEALADLNAARNGATDNEDVGRHLAALAAAASGLPATRRSESTLPLSASSASASALAAEQREICWSKLFGRNCLVEHFCRRNCFVELVWSNIFARTIMAEHFWSIFFEHGRSNILGRT